MKTAIQISGCLALLALSLSLFSACGGRHRVDFPVMSEVTAHHAPCNRGPDDECGYDSSGKFWHAAPFTGPGPSEPTGPTPFEILVNPNMGDIRLKILITHELSARDCGQVRPKDFERCVKNQFDKNYHYYILKDVNSSVGAPGPLGRDH